MWARARVDQDQVRQLPVGEADLIVRGLTEHVRIIRTKVPGSVETVARGLTRPPCGRPAPEPCTRTGTSPGRSPPGYQVRRQRLKPRAGQTPGRLLPSLTRRRRPRSGGTGPQGRAVKPARKATAEGEATEEQ